MIDSCGVLLLTCDKYFFVAEQNLKILNKMWPDNEFPVYCLSETKSSNNEKVKSICINDKRWSYRLKKALDFIKEEFVLIILDDFFIEEPVKNNLVHSYLSHMIENRSIANISFSKMLGTNKKSKKIINCLSRSGELKSYVNCQIGLWNKNCLSSLICEDENPWQAELFGSIRAMLYPEYKFYCLENDKYSPFIYDKGWLIVRGKWNEPEVKRIQNKLKIQIDLGDLDIENMNGKINDSFWSKAKMQLMLLQYKNKIKKLLKENNK